MSEPNAAQGTAEVSASSSGYVLTFSGDTQASGAVAIRYTLTNAWGTSTPATVTLQVTTRPDPSKDAEVIGLLNVQAQSAEEFANAEIGKLNDCLEQLHSEHTRHDGLFNVHVGLPQTRAPHSGIQVSTQQTGILTGDSTAGREAADNRNAASP